MGVWDAGMPTKETVVQVATSGRGTQGRESWPGLCGPPGDMILTLSDKGGHSETPSRSPDRLRWGAGAGTMAGSENRVDPGAPLAVSPPALFWGSCTEAGFRDAHASQDPIPSLENRVRVAMM